MTLGKRANSTSSCTKHSQNTQGKKTTQTTKDEGNNQVLHVNYTYCRCVCQARCGTAPLLHNNRDGIHIIVRGQKTCASGQIVVASHIIDPFEATLKEFRPKEDLVYLHPANSVMDPICIPKEEWNREWQIQGIVIFSFHFHEKSILESLGWYE
jgi:hypothetical protein